MIIEQITHGNSIIDIAEKYNVSPYFIYDINGICPKDDLMDNEEILVRIPTRVYNAKKSESIGTLCERFDVSPKELIINNPSLHGREKLYEGQPIVVKYPAPAMGNIVMNGYYYYGCTPSMLAEKMPYLTSITVACAVSKQNNVTLLFDDTQILKKAKDAGINTFLRIYADVSCFSSHEQILLSVILMAKTKDYDGIDLVPIGYKNTEALSKLMFNARKMALENDLLLMCECNMRNDCSHTDFANVSVARFDKSSNKSIESFEKGEKRFFTSFAEKYEPSATLIDLSPFAFCGGKYVNKALALQKGRRRNWSFELNNETLECHVKGQENENKQYIFEGLSNLKKRMELVGELGFMGVSIDVMRTDIRELMLICSSFAPTIGCKGNRGSCIG